MALADTLNLIKPIRFIRRRQATKLSRKRFGRRWNLCCERIRTMELDGCDALITGASAGIGLEFAQQLASRATTLILIARRRQRLEELRLELAAGNKELRVEIRPTDLSKHDEIDELVRWLEAEKLIVD